MQSVPKYGLIHRIHSLELVYFLQVQSVNMQGLFSFQRDKQNQEFFLF